MPHPHGRPRHPRGHHPRSRLRPDFGGAAFRADHEPVLPAAAPSARRAGERGPARRGRERHPARREQPPPCGLGHAPPDAHAGGQGREDLPPAPAHTKLLLIDGEYTLLGSANLDPRSLNLNFELVMEVLDLRLAEQLSAFYDEVRSRSVSVPTTYPALPYRLRNAASWIFSPYL